MYENIYGFSCVENQVLAILNQLKVKIEFTYHDCAMPLQELFSLLVCRGIKQENFNYLPRVQDILKKRNIISFVLKHPPSIEFLIDEIFKCGINEWVLIRVTPEFTKEVLSSRGLRADHYVLVNAVTNGFNLYNDIPERIETVSKQQLTEAFDGDYFKFNLLRDLKIADADILWDTRLYKPENMKPFILEKNCIDRIENIGTKLRNMTGVYRILLQRMTEYYGIYADVGYIRDRLPEIERLYALLEYYNLKKKTPLEKYHNVVDELSSINESVLTQLRMELGDVNYVRDKNKQYFNGNCIS